MNETKREDTALLTYSCFLVRTNEGKGGMGHLVGFQLDGDFPHQVILHTHTHKPYQVISSLFTFFSSVC